MIATFEKGQGFQALVQYSDPNTAEQVTAHLVSELVQADVPRLICILDETDAHASLRCTSSILLVHWHLSWPQLWPPRTSCQSRMLLAPLQRTAREGASAAQWAVR